METAGERPEQGQVLAQQPGRIVVGGLAGDEHESSNAARQFGAPGRGYYRLQRSVVEYALYYAEEVRALERLGRTGLERGVHSLR
jgi:hypothetical protein